MSAASLECLTTAAAVREADTLLFHGTDRAESLDQVLQVLRRRRRRDQAMRYGAPTMPTHAGSAPEGAGAGVCASCRARSRRWRRQRERAEERGDEEGADDVLLGVVGGGGQIPRAPSDGGTPVVGPRAGRGRCRWSRCCDAKRARWCCARPVEDRAARGQPRRREGAWAPRKSATHAAAGAASTPSHRGPRRARSSWPRPRSPAQRRGEVAASAGELLRRRRSERYVEAAASASRARRPAPPRRRRLAPASARRSRRGQCAAGAGVPHAVGRGDPSQEAGARTGP